MPEVLVSPAARADLIAQWDFFADDVGNPALADRFVACAEATFKKLARTPSLGRVRSFASPKAKNLRSWKVNGFPKHLIFYRALPGDPGVEIISVVHGARDLLALFGK
jgi:toxin ParE1/3/4